MVRVISVVQPAAILPTSRDVVAGRGRVSVIHRNARSVVSEAFATSPLRVLTPSNHGTGAWIFLSSYGGGLVDGDHTALDVRVDTGASAYVSSQASTKVYRSPRGTSATVTIHVEDGALLVWMPDPVVCFRGSRYRQMQECHLAANGGLVMVDWMTSGRRASGERWEFAEYSSEIVVYRGGRRIAHDSVALRASDGALQTRMGRFDVLATAIVAGAPLAERADAIVAIAGSAPVVRRGDLLMFAAPLRDGAGCAIKIAGRSVQQVGAAIRRAVGFVPALLGEDPWARKW
jgi:urease accessory protein